MKVGSTYGKTKTERLRLDAEVDTTKVLESDPRTMVEGRTKECENDRKIKDGGPSTTGSEGRRIKKGGRRNTKPT